MSGEGGGATLAARLRDALDANLARAVDLFREWDDDASGTVSRREFRRALALLGVKCERSAADALFDQLDFDGSGKLEYTEIHKNLRKRLEDHPDSAPPVAARRVRRLRRRRLPQIEWDVRVPGLDFKPSPQSDQASTPAVSSPTPERRHQRRRPYRRGLTA